MQPTFIPPVANPKKPRLLAGKMMWVIIGGVVAILLGSVLLMFANSSDPAEDIDRLNARMDSLVAIIKQGSTLARTSELQKINSDASILLVGDTASLKLATSTNSDVGKNKAVIQSEDVSNTIKKIKAASVDGRFDSVYIAELNQQLTKTMELLKRVYNRTNSPALKTATDDAYKHCGSISDALAKLSQ